MRYTEEEKRKEMGKRIRSALKFRGISQKNLAEELNMSVVNLNNIINGKTGLTYSNAAAIAEYLDIQLAYLLLESDYMTVEEEEKAEFNATINHLFEEMDELTALLSLTGIRVKEYSAEYQNDDIRAPFHLRFQRDPFGDSKEYVCPAFMLKSFEDDIRDYAKQKAMKLLESLQTLESNASNMELGLQFAMKEIQTKEEPPTP